MTTTRTCASRAPPSVTRAQSRRSGRHAHPRFRDLPAGQVREEALRLGGHVRKGERATPVVYWKWRTDEDMRKLRDKTGKESFAPCVPFVSAVFNLDQVEQVGRPEDDVPRLPNNRVELAEQVYAGMPDKPVIKHAATYQPVYVPSLDEVLMPHLEQFENGAAYYAALFHELAHSTGHATRLNRFKDAEGTRIRLTLVSLPGKSHVEVTAAFAVGRGTRVLSCAFPRHDPAALAAGLLGQ